jgi:hypothetical protein
VHKKVGYEGNKGGKEAYNLYKKIMIKEMGQVLDYAGNSL